MHILFDFDGTLINSFDCVLEKALQLAEEHNFRTFETHEIEGFRDLSSIEIIQKLKVPFYKVPILISQMRAYLYQQMPLLKPVTGVQEILEKLHEAQYTIGILTSNSVENVEIWLNMNNMRHLISFIHSESSYFTKRFLIKKTLRQYNIDKSKTVYIGDETRDIYAARKNNISSIAVTWGYNSEKAIMKYNPSFIAKKPSDILLWCNL